MLVQNSSYLIFQIFPLTNGKTSSIYNMFLTEQCYVIEMIVYYISHIIFPYVMNIFYRSIYNFDFIKTQHQLTERWL